MGRNTSARRRGRVNFKAIFLLLIVILLLFVVFNYKKLAPKNMADWFAGAENSADGGYPYYLSNNSAVDMQTDGKRLILLTDSAVIFLNNSASEVFRSQHSYSSPNMDVNNERVLLYDRGGKDYKIVNSSRVIYTGKTEENISLGAMGENGCFALVTSSSRGSSELDVFDRHQNQLLYWTTANEYIIGVSLNAKGSLAVVSTISSVDTKLCSKLYLLDLEKGETVADFPFEKNTIIDFYYHENGSVTVITDEFVSFISKELICLDNVSYSGGTITRYSVSDKGEVAVLLKEFDTGQSRVLTVSADGKQTGEIKVDKMVKWLDYRNGKINLLMADRLVCYNRGLKPDFEVPVSNSASRMLVVRKNAYLLSVSDISQYRVS